MSKVYLEESLKKIKHLMEIQSRGNLVQVETVRGEVWLCEPLYFAQDEDDWAYDVKVLNDPAFEYVVLEGCYIKSIEEVPQQSA